MTALCTPVPVHPKDGAAAGAGPFQLCHWAREARAPRDSPKLLCSCLQQEREGGRGGNGPAMEFEPGTAGCVAGWKSWLLVTDLLSVLRKGVWRSQREEDFILRRASHECAMVPSALTDPQKACRSSIVHGALDGASAMLMSLWEQTLWDELSSPLSQPSP